MVEVMRLEVARWDNGERAERRYSWRDRVVSKLPYGILREVANDLNWNQFIIDYLGDQRDAIQEKSVLVLFGRFRIGLPYRRYPGRYAPDRLPNLS